MKKLDKYFHLLQLALPPLDIKCCLYKGSFNDVQKPTPFFPSLSKDKNEVIDKEKNGKPNESMTSKFM